MPGAIPFISGQQPAGSGLLTRYLPPIPGGIGASWLAQHLPLPASTKDSPPWILDPFGSAPHLAVEMARSGYRVVVAANNPVARFLLELDAKPPQVAELRATLADLAASSKGDERLEPHIRSLYLTECAQCGREVMAEAFLWDRGAQAPFGRIYHCPHCGDAGERPVGESDILRASHLGSNKLHRARALERVAPLDDPDRPHAEEALAVYLPRAVYILFTLINKLDNFSSPRRAHLAALILAACDQANTLWPYPAARSRPRQLTVPPRFRENNIWLALEEAVDHWAEIEKLNQPGLEITVWPELPPPGGGLCLFEGRLKELTQTLGNIPVSAVVTALPRPNQAYWTLSALWAGWLWGREATASFKSVLRRRRYDWAWHCTALHSALSILTAALPPGTPIFGLIGEAEPGFLSAALIASGLAGFRLSGLALRQESGEAQIQWSSGEPDADLGSAKSERTSVRSDFAKREVGRLREQKFARTPDQVQELSRTAARDYLQARGEPVHYLYLHTAALSALAQNLNEYRSPDLSPADFLSQAQGAIQKAFSYRSGFVRYNGSDHTLEVGQWWLKDEQEVVELPLADRVEMGLVNYLVKLPGCSFRDLDAAMCAAFPGLLTPDLELIRTCLESYGEEQPPESERWFLRPQDLPKARKVDLELVKGLLVEMGNRLGYETDRDNQGQPALPGAVHWRESTGNLEYVYYVVASAIIGKIISLHDCPEAKAVIVYPGGRARLVAYKLSNDTRSSQAARSWNFLKFRHLRRLTQNPQLDRESWKVQLNLDPFTSDDPQIALL